jgi:4-amino-4-deoxychorismate lyase
MNEQEIYFETIKCDDGTAFHLNYHCKRIARTIMLNIQLQEYILPISDELLKCKVFYDKYGVLDVQYEPYKKRKIERFKLVYDDEIQYSKKSINRECIDTLFEKREDADEIIIIKNNLVTDTSIANIAVFDGNRWLTPKKPLLLGTTRERLLQNQEIHEANITQNDLKNAQQIALLNAMVGMDIYKTYEIV